MFDEEKDILLLENPKGRGGEILLDIFIGNNKQILYSLPDTGVISLAEFNQTAIDIASHMFQILYRDQGGAARFRKIS